MSLPSHREVDLEDRDSEDRDSEDLDSEDLGDSVQEVLAGHVQIGRWSRSSISTEMDDSIALSEARHGRLSATIPKVDDGAAGLAATLPAVFDVWPHAWPVAAQIGLVIVAAEFLEYWRHRLAHRVPLLWRAHELHHSGDQLNVLKSSRNHILDLLMRSLMVFTPLVLLGAPAIWMPMYSAAVLVVGPLSHANLALRFPRWLHYVIATPDVHAIHHARAESLADRNFSILPLLDIAFGTFEHPEGHGRPAAGVRLLLSQAPRDGDREQPGDIVVLTGADGSFQRRGLIGRTWFLRAYVPGMRSMLRRAVLPLADPLELAFEKAVVEGKEVLKPWTPHFVLHGSGVLNDTRTGCLMCTHDCPGGLIANNALPLKQPIPVLKANWRLLLKPGTKVTIVLRPVPSAAPKPRRKQP